MNQKLKYNDLVSIVEQGIYQLNPVAYVEPATEMPEEVTLGDFVARGGSLMLIDREDASLAGTFNRDKINEAAEKFLEMQGGETDFYNEFRELNINLEDGEAEILELAAFGEVVYG